MTRVPHTRKNIVTLARLGLAAGISLAAAGACQAQETSAKALRQLGVMEQIIDKVLLDSPNFLVHGRDNTHGLLIEPVGAVFTFDASLVNEFSNLKDYLADVQNRFEVKEDENGDQVIVIKKGDKKKEDSEAKAEAKAEAESKKPTPETLLDRGKNELVQALMDYGETLSILKEGQSIIIAGFVETESFLPGKEGVTRLIVRSKIDDLRALSAGKISESELRSRIRVEMY